MLVAKRELDVAANLPRRPGTRLFLLPSGQHPFADTSLPNVLSFLDNDTAREPAAAVARHDGIRLVEDSTDIETCEGAATIGLELTDTVPPTGLDNYSAPAAEA
jgi:hypothetical protein